MPEQEIGRVTHYFGKLEVAAITVTDGELRPGDAIHIRGHTTDLTMTVESIQLEHESLELAKPGDEIGLKVPEHVREHDVVYKVTE